MKCSPGVVSVPSYGVNVWDAYHSICAQESILHLYL